MRPPRTLVLCLGLLLAGLAAYSPLWVNDFVDFDDAKHITENTDVLNGLSLEGVCWAWSEHEPYWMPLTRLSLQLDAHLFGVKTGETVDLHRLAVAVHAHNLLWHLVSVLLLFGLLWRLTGARERSFLVAGLFAVHPMHVESVAWAVERKDVLSCFFGLLAVWAYVRYRERPHWGRYLAILGAYLLSLLAKPMLMTLPFVLLLLDYWPLRRKASASRLLLEKMPLFLLAALSGIVTLASRDDSGTLVSLNQLSLSSRLGNALVAYGWYLQTTFWPSRLAILYPHPRQHWSVPAAVVGALLLVSVTFLCWRLRKSRPWLLVGWLWFVGTLVPVIGFAQGGRQAWADRFSYWPHIGLFIALVWVLAELAGRLRLPAVMAAAGSAIVLGALALVTGIQVTHWRSSQTLWEQAVAATQDNDKAHEYLSVNYRRLGQSGKADFHLRKAYSIQKERLKIEYPRKAPEPIRVGAGDVGKPPLAPATRR